MIPILINGLIPSSDRETEIKIFDSDERTLLCSGKADGTGFVRLEIPEEKARSVVMVLASARHMKDIIEKIPVDPDGIFLTVKPRANENVIRSIRLPLVLPTDWEASAREQMERLRRTSTFPALTLRRAREDSRVRYFQHFTSMWSAFNSWYNQTLTNPSTDRDCIETLKAGAEAASLKVRRAIDVLAAPSLLASTTKHNNIGAEARREFMLPTPLTNFVQQARDCTFVQIGVYVGETSDQPPKPAGRPAIRCAPLAYITQAEYERLYRTLRAAQSTPPGMMESDDISVQNALQCLGIDSVGSVIFPFGQKPIPPITHPVVVDAIRNECQQIDTLARMLRVQSEGSYSGIYAGFIELLYCVRNLIVHGELSPIDPENEDLIEAAYKILDKLLFEVGKV